MKYFPRPVNTLLITLLSAVLMIILCHGIYSNFNHVLGGNYAWQPADSGSSSSDTDKFDHGFDIGVQCLYDIPVQASDQRGFPVQVLRTGDSSSCSSEPSKPSVDMAAILINGCFYSIIVRVYYKAARKLIRLRAKAVTRAPAPA